jgi:hypothetical protein
MREGSSKLLNHQQLKSGCHNDAKFWLNHWRIKEEVIMENTNDIKNTITTKFEENLWCHKEFQDKRKLRYYKEMVNPNLENQKYLFLLRVKDTFF